MAATKTSNNIQLIKKLIEKGADTEYQCKSGTPFIAAVDGGKVENLKYFVKKLKYNVNRCDLQGNSPLYVATYKGNEEVVKMLLEEGGDPWIKGPN